jgi:hypothetical protein
LSKSLRAQSQLRHHPRQFALTLAFLRLGFVDDDVFVADPFCVVFLTPLSLLAFFMTVALLHPGNRIVSPNETHNCAESLARSVIVVEIASERRWQ